MTDAEILVEHAAEIAKCPFTKPNPFNFCDPCSACGATNNDTCPRQVLATYNVLRALQAREAQS